MYYDVTIIAVRPGAEQKALARLKETLPSVAGDGLLACWYCDIGALNRILLIRAAPDIMGIHEDREKILRSGNPFGVGEYVAATSMDTYVSFPFMPPMTAGQYGPVFEVRTYVFKPDGVPATIELWRKWVPGRAKLSPLLAAMHSVTGAVTRFMHIWPSMPASKSGRGSAQRRSRTSFGRRLAARIISPRCSPTSILPPTFPRSAKAALRQGETTKNRDYSAATDVAPALSLGLSSQASSQLSTLSDLTNLPTPSTSAQNSPSSMISSSLKCLARSV
jgi:NIPSNAP protein